ncbi:MAG: Panacea domain-containing protein [Dehalococcoidia bacterium]
MNVRKPRYNEQKATQATCILLELNGGEMSLLKLMKLIYNVEREAINRWMRPITFGNSCSMPHGQVISEAYDNAKLVNQARDSFWTKHIRTFSNNKVRLINNDCGIDKLSKAEIKLLQEMFEKYKNKTALQMRNEHHDKDLFPEYSDPGNSSIMTTYEDILIALGKTENQIEEFKKDLRELSILEGIKS